MHDWWYECGVFMSVLCFGDGFMLCVAFPAWAFSYIFVHGYIKKRWHTSWKFQFEKTSNKKVIAKKPLTNLYEMNSTCIYMFSDSLKLDIEERRCEGKGVSLNGR